MDILFSKNPMIGSMRCKSINDYTYRCFNEATQLNIATGFISNESIAELKRLVDFRDKELKLSLFIGMNYLDGFTRLQYEAVRDLDRYLSTENIGNVFVSPKAMFHGKMYSFLTDSQCLCSFVGSSNLGSFIGTSRKYIESDVYFPETEGALINKRILEITYSLGETICQAKEITQFIEPTYALLDGYEHVQKLSKAYLDKILFSPKGQRVHIPLKTEPKSNLNTYFGAGKIKGKFSRRDYYEVEIIISNKTPYSELLPKREDGDFWVVTNDGYKFQCSRQGDYDKNFRSSHDLKILGRWIKGQMENCGALKLGDPVTEQTLEKFGKRNIVLAKCKNEDCWLLSLE